MDWPERQAPCPGAPFGVARWSRASSASRERGAHSLVNRGVSFRPRFIAVTCGHLASRRCSLGVGRAADREPAALLWTRLDAEFAPIVSATNLTAQRRAVEALRD
jgi:hypothetical protein